MEHFGVEECASDQRMRSLIGTELVAVGVVSEEVATDSLRGVQLEYALDIYEFHVRLRHGEQV